jgi:hypothetical protein
MIMGDTERNHREYAEQVIFMRQRQREIQAIKDSTAEKLVDQAIDMLALLQDPKKVVQAKLNNTLPENYETLNKSYPEFSTYYVKLNSGSYKTKFDYSKALDPRAWWEHYTLNRKERKTIENAIRGVVTQVTQAAKDKFDLIMDLKALGLPEGAVVDKEDFKKKWEQVQATVFKNEHAQILDQLIEQQFASNAKEEDYLYEPMKLTHTWEGWTDLPRYLWINKAALWDRWKNYGRLWVMPGDNSLKEPQHHQDVLKNIKITIEEQQKALLKRIPLADREPGIIDETFKYLFRANSYKKRLKNKETIDAFNANAKKLYHEALVAYYNSLKRDNPVEQVSENDDTDTKRRKELKIQKERNKLAYLYGYQLEDTKDELKNKQDEQTFLRSGFTITKLFALAQGVFVGGAWFFLFFNIAPVAAYALIAPLLYVMFHAARSNWISANDEMGPSLKSLFYNPGHVRLNPLERMVEWVRHSELSWGAFKRTLKGQANFVASAFIALLTMTGGFALLDEAAQNSAATLSFGPFGTIFWPTLIVVPLLASVTLLIYFVLTNGSQIEENRVKEKAAKEGRVYLADYNERLNKLNAINNVKNPLRGYHVGVAAALFGIGSTLVGASGVLETFFKTGLYHKGQVVFKVGSLSLSGPATLAALASIIVVSIACIGMFVFYRRRTRGSTENGISSIFGTTFNELKGHKLKSMDLTGMRAPDLKTHAYKTSDSIFFTTHEQKVDAGVSRVVNAIGQAGPAILGAMLFFTLLTVGAAALVGGDLVVATVIGQVAGAMAGITAAAASYSANSTGNRQPQENVTEVDVLTEDLAALEQAEVKKELANSNFFQLGVIRRDATRYKEARERQGEVDGLGLSVVAEENSMIPSIIASPTKSDKLPGADSIIETLDNLADMEEPGNKGVDLTVKNPMFLNYVNGKADDLTLRNGRLGKIAGETKELFIKIR